jgi:hypothetical protein
MKTMVCTVLVLASALVLAGSAAAAEKQWICSITEAVEYSEGMECVAPDLGGVEPPSFLHVDIDKKVVTLLAPASRRGETNRIDQAQETNRGWILAGIDGARAWSIYLTTDGTMTLTIAMDGTTWSAFGRCMPAADAKP